MDVGSYIFCTDGKDVAQGTETEVLGQDGILNGLDDRIVQSGTL